MQHQLRLSTVHTNSLSYKANSDVQRPTHDIDQEIQLSDLVLLSRLWQTVVIAAAHNYV